MKGCGKAAAAAAASAAEAEKKEDFNKPNTSDKGNRNTNSVPMVGLAEAAEESNNVQELPPPPPQTEGATGMGIHGGMDNGGS